MSIKKTLLAISQARVTHIDASAISAMDSAGALVLYQLIHFLGTKPTLDGLKNEFSALLALVDTPEKSRQLPRQTSMNFLSRVGIIAIDKILEFQKFLAFIGEISVDGLSALGHPKRIPVRATLSVMESTGVYALPLIALLSFLIGVVLAYQMGLQLKNYGANIYIVDLLGISLLREFSPLITAIIIAGRSGSAFTAQLGTMKIREEIDALRTMGIAPSDFLILPKLLGMMIVLPLLTVWSSIFGIMGGMFISKIMLNVTYPDFLQRFYEAISVSYYYTGMIKAPVFGLVIAAVGCYQGTQVAGSATSVGEKTTQSVVQSIFLIIIIDAAFSILFSALGI